MRSLTDLVHNRADNKSLRNLLLQSELHYMIQIADRSIVPNCLDVEDQGIGRQWRSSPMAGSSGGHVILLTMMLEAAVSPQKSLAL